MVVASPGADKRVSLYAAGSLRSALGDISHEFERVFGASVEARFGPSGLLRERIESGERAQVFASANMAHPEALAVSLGVGPVVTFARNSLCALVRGGAGVTGENLLDRLLDPAVRLGTSTPGADPSGDYAWQLFDKAEALRPGAGARLKEKAMMLTGGRDPQAVPVPAGCNAYAWMIRSDRVDVFLTYGTNAILAQQEVPSLDIVPLPGGLAVGADYGVVVLDHSSADAWRLTFHLLSPAGQAVLARYGFEARATVPC